MFMNKNKLLSGGGKNLTGGGVGLEGEGSEGRGGGKWGERGREVGIGYPPVHPLCTVHALQHLLMYCFVFLISYNKASLINMKMH